jgi:hypothetical protein
VTANLKETKSRRWLPFPGDISSEGNLAQRVLKKLEPHFLSAREVRGKYCDGSPLRIDAILRPKNPGPWYDEHPALGIEFKWCPPWDDTNIVTRLAEQARDYAHSDWPGYGRICIFTCPPVSQVMEWRGVSRESIFLDCRVLGQAGVGELGLTRHGLTFVISGEPLWRESNGLVQRRSLIPRKGSR